MRPPVVGDRVAPLQPAPPPPRDPGGPALPPLPVRPPRRPRGPRGTGGLLPGVHGRGVPTRKAAEREVSRPPSLPSQQLPPLPPRLDARFELAGRGRAERMGGKPIRHPPRLPRRPHRGRPRPRVPHLPRRADAGEATGPTPSSPSSTFFTSLCRTNSGDAIRGCPPSRSTGG